MVGFILNCGMLSAELPWKIWEAYTIVLLGSPTYEKIVIPAKLKVTIHLPTKILQKIAPISSTDGYRHARNLYLVTLKTLNMMMSNDEGLMNPWKGPFWQLSHKVSQAGGSDDFPISKMN